MESLFGSHIEVIGEMVAGLVRKSQKGELFKLPQEEHDALIELGGHIEQYDKAVAFAKNFGPVKEQGC